MRSFLKHSCACGTAHDWLSQPWYKAQITPGESKERGDSSHHPPSLFRHSSRPSTYSPRPSLLIPRPSSLFPLTSCFSPLASRLSPFVSHLSQHLQLRHCWPGNPSFLSGSTPCPSRSYLCLLKTAQHTSPRSGKGPATASSPTSWLNCVFWINRPRHTSYCWPPAIFPKI